MGTGKQKSRHRSRAEMFLDHLDRLIGTEPRFNLFAAGDAPKITSIIYHDQPEPRLLTAFTYGLSLSQHPDWKLSAPELSICVQSEDPAWGWALAALAANLRGKCPFCYGTTINFAEPISQESKMSAFVIFAPLVLDGQGAMVRLPDCTVHIVGAYPLYEGELGLIKEIGLKAFWELPGFDPYNVHRPDLSAN